MIGFPNMVPYAASIIRVNTTGPGPIANRMMASLEAQQMLDDPAAMHAALIEMVPMKRHGTNEEVAQLALFLASNESSYCTGAMFAVDGGFTAS